MDNEIRISIPKDAIPPLKAVTFPGKITLIDRPEQVEAAVEALMQERELGFDTETKPSFTRGRANKVALMQISTADHAYLFRLNKIGMPDALIRLIENPDIVKIGLSIKDDFFVMHRSKEFEPQGFIEIQNLVRDYGIQDSSLQRVYAIIFGHRISKAQRLTNWEARALTPAQQTYAAIDAWACLRIYRHLLAGNFHPEQSPWRLPDPDPATP